MHTDGKKKGNQIQCLMFLDSDGPIGLKIAKAHTKAMTQRKPVPQDCREWEIWMYQDRVD